MNASGNKRLVLAIMTALTAGVVNYYLFRPGIVLFRWVATPHSPLRLDNPLLQRFFTGYFSDIAWCLALVFLMVLFSRKGYLDSSGKLLILTTPFLIETAQFFNLVPGVFDWYDIAVFALIESIVIVRYLKYRL